MDRRTIIKALGTGSTMLAWAALTRSSHAQALVTQGARLPAGTVDEAMLDQLPGKQKLIKLSYRPPNYETPLAAFDSAVTPNDQFFVRYHLAGLPELSALKTWSLSINGDAVDRPATYALEDLKRKFPVVTVAAVCQCSGNRRGLSSPHVPGVQWGYGAMGSAAWTGIRLKDVLAKSGIKTGAVEIVLNGADMPVLQETPDFQKSLPIDAAIEDNVIIAFAMNGRPLPFLNGFPARLVVPGWTATYWMKHITTIEVRQKPFDGFWMRKAYRVPKGMFATDYSFATQDDDKTTPITQILVNSLITNLTDHMRVSAGGFLVKGIAWDGGHGIRTVEVSADGGGSWHQAKLGRDLGRFAFREWNLQIAKASPGALTVIARATASNGATQVDQLVFNPAGYHNNVTQKLPLTAA